MSDETKSNASAATTAQKSLFILESFVKPNFGPVLTHFRYERNSAARLIRSMRNSGFGIRIVTRP